MQQQSIIKVNRYSWRTYSAFLHDTFAALVAWYLAFLLRFNFSIPDYIDSIWLVASFVIPIQAIFFVWFGLYRGVWRFASLPDLKRILFAIAISAAAIIVLLFMFKPMDVVVPRSVLVLDPILLIMMMGGSRFLYRSWKEHQLYGLNLMRGEPVLVLGAGEAAIALLKDLERSQEWRVVGILDDNTELIGRELIGIKVLGRISQLATIAQQYDVKDVILAKPTEAHQERRRAIEIASAADLNVLTVPSVEDLMNGNVKVSKIRHVEIEDLLGRDAVELDNSGLQQLIQHKTVLVTGAGGSIGSEICRQVIKFKPSHLVCFDLSEYALYQLEQEFSRLQLTDVKLHFLTGDVKNQSRVHAVLNQFRPTVVYHAAAYKHVPLMENANVVEALHNNVVGTYTMARACAEAQVEKFVLISTDKAVNPTNVMGASKRLAEMTCQGLQHASLNSQIAANQVDFNQTVFDKVTSLPHSTQFIIVRFGNVLGSSGSVIPKFREQIAKGGPVTITHPEITRYFMSIPEAAQLVMQAGLMGKGGDIFVLDMGESVKIAELAATMIKLSGFHEDEIKIEYVGLRPGEKLYEELLADDERTLPTPHHKLRIASARSVEAAWVEALLTWIKSLQFTDETDIKTGLKYWVEEYTPDLPVSGANVEPNAQYQSVKNTQVTLH